jgi:hypothetical protein
MSRTAQPKAAASCPFCLSWGVFRRADSCCRACYDFGRTYPGGECAGCRRLIAIKNGYCRLCWLQAGITAAGRARITAADLTPGACHQQLSFAGMNQRIGHVDPPHDRPSSQPAPQPPRPADCTGTQLELCGPGESRHFDKRHWVASKITNSALLKARHIARDLAGTRGWNPRIVTETGRALAVILAGHTPGDRIPWSGLSPALRSRDLSVTRTAEILGLAGLLDDDRIPSFTALMQARLAVLPAPMAADVGHWLRTRSDGGPRSRPRSTDTVRMNLNRVHPLLLEWASHHSHLREITTGEIIAATEPLPATQRRQTLTALRSLFAHCKKTGTIFRDPARGIHDPSGL